MTNPFHFKSKFNSVDSILLFIIVATGAVLRLYNLSEIPFMHDEFSALFRTEFDNFKDLIRFGVKEKDTHPAGVQVFMYYWVNWFGTSEAIVKLPFIIFGIFSIYLVYKIGKAWFGSTSGLLAAAFMAVTQYNVMYSQLARPYASGLFLTLLMVFFWTWMIKAPGKKKYLYMAAYILASGLSAYNHAFTLLFTGIVFITGLFIIEKRFFKSYIIAGISILILYIQHLPIFFYHLSLGGIGWLSAPTLSFLPDYLFYTLHFSYPFLALFVALFLLGFFLNRNSIIKSSYRMISGLWFILPIIVGYLYSYIFSPMLQYSVLLFTFPYLLIFTFSFYGEIKVLTKCFIIFLILGTGISTLIINRDHYNIFYTQGFDDIPKQIESFKEENPDKNISVYLYSATPRMMQFYFEKYAYDYSNYNHYKGQPELIRLKEKIMADSSEYLIYAWTDGQLREFQSIIEEKYPYVIDKIKYFNAEFYVYSRHLVDPTYMHDIILERKIGFDENEGSASDSILPATVGTDTTDFAYSCFMDSSKRYSPKIQVRMSELSHYPLSKIKASVTAYCVDSVCDAMLVLSVYDPMLKKNISWHASGFKHFINEPGIWENIYNSTRTADFLHKAREDCILSVYVWNRKGEKLFIDDLELRVFDDGTKTYDLLLEQF